jgi:hypothetical protein
MFWLKQKNIGRLHFLVGRNDDIKNRNQKRWTFRMEHLNGQGFLTFRIGVRFLNIDWT